MKKFINIWLSVLLVLILSGCKTTDFSMNTIKDSLSNTKNPNFDDNELDVGPKINDKLLTKDEEELNKDIPARKLSIIIPSFDPNLEQKKKVRRNSTNAQTTGPAEPSKKTSSKDKIYPELRKVESKRFAIKLKDSLDKTNLLGAVRVSPDATASGEIYILGKINESDATEVSIGIKVVDVSGRLLMDKNFSHDVEECVGATYTCNKKDSYQNVFDEAAENISLLLQRMNEKSISKLSYISDLRFANEFSPESFSEYLTKSNGKYDLVGLPDDEDPMWKRVKAIKVREQFFVDTLQIHYQKFNTQVERGYLLWQQKTFKEQEAERIARNKQIGRNVLGILAIGVAIVAAANNSSADFTGEMMTATVGAKLLEDAQKYGAEANMHQSTVVELSRSVESEMAPNVITFEEKTIELQGNATQQFVQWRSFLKRIVELERTPEKQL